MRLLSYNMAQRPAAWQDVLAVDADVAMVQEVASTGDGGRGNGGRFQFHGEPWNDKQGDPSVVWKSAVVRTSDRVHVEWIHPHLAWVKPPDEERILVMSMYGRWRRSDSGTTIYADASVHDLISALSPYIVAEKGHRIIAAGDLNILYGYGENGSSYWKGRYDSVFARMAALGMVYMGPCAPNGRLAEPWPSELPQDSMCVPTYHTNRKSPAEATRQLDHVFVSRDLAHHVSVRALNGVEEWGRSDHCRVVVELGER
jgi:hypothetical protein